jgi:predicted Fe-Mo cluster-binding NifX family protein
MEKGRIAVPSDGKGGIDGQRAGHFGHCDVFTIIDVDGGKITNISTLENGDHSQGGCMVPVNLLAQNNVNAIIVGGIGMRPLMGFRQSGIDVYYENKCREIKTVVDELIAGKLTIISNDQTCGGGGHHH